MHMICILKSSNSIAELLLVTFVSLQICDYFWEKQLQEVYHCDEYRPFMKKF